MQKSSERMRETGVGALARGVKEAVAEAVGSEKMGQFGDKMKSQGGPGHRCLDSKSKLDVCFFPLFFIVFL